MFNTSAWALWADAAANWPQKGQSVNQSCKAVLGICLSLHSWWQGWHCTPELNTLLFLMDWCSLEELMVLEKDWNHLQVHTAHKHRGRAVLED